MWRCLPRAQRVLLLATRSNMSGQTVMFFGGVLLLYSTTLRAETRVAGAVQLVSALIGQLFYMFFWATTDDVEAFFGNNGKPLSRTSRPLSHPLLRCTHPLCGFVLRPWLVLTIFVFFYISLATLLAIVANIESELLGAAFCAASAAWNAWIAMLFALSTLLSLCAANDAASTYVQNHGPEAPLPPVAPLSAIPVDESLQITTVNELRDLIARVRPGSR